MQIHHDNIKIEDQQLFAGLKGIAMRPTALLLKIPAPLSPKCTLYPSGY